MLSAATVLPKRMAVSEQPLDENGVVESRHRTAALLDVRAPRPPLAPRATLTLPSACWT